jgi:hypothetical protein
MRILIITILSLIFAANSYAQTKWWVDKKYKNDRQRVIYTDCKLTFESIAEGFNSGDLSSITKNFDAQVYLDILNIDKGYYSANQAELILKDFMNYYTTDNFYYTGSHAKSDFAFAIGYYIYYKGSSRVKLNASVSLYYKDESWYIDQISLQ